MRAVVVIPTLNARELLAEAVASIEAQTASLLTRMIASASPASAAPRFTARPKPRFSAFWTTVT